MVRGASRWLPWSRRGRLGRGLSDTTPARCQRVIADVAPRSTGGFGRTVTRGCVASGHLFGRSAPHVPVTAPGHVAPRSRTDRERLRPASAQRRARGRRAARPPPPGGSARPGPARGRRDGSPRCSGPAAGSTSNELVASDWATTSGRSTSASSEASTAASMAAWSVLWKAGVKPHRFIDTRASGDRVAGSRPSPATKPPSGVAVTWRRSSTPRSVPSAPTRQMPRVTGEKPMTASARR